VCADGADGDGAAARTVGRVLSVIGPETRVPVVVPGVADDSPPAGVIVLVRWMTTTTWLGAPVADAVWAVVDVRDRPIAPTRPSIVARPKPAAPMRAPLAGWRRRRVR
jgi:hypothetical protein